MKANKFITMLVLILGLLSCGFVEKQPKKLEKQVVASFPGQDILGVWVLENDPSTKIEFFANGQVKTYEDNILQFIDTYSIVNTCDGNTNSDGSLFLKIIDGEDGTAYCEIINGINENNSGILSLMSDNGKLIIYKRP